VADEIVQIRGRIPGHLNVLRALNPKHLDRGLPSDEHFVMSPKHSPDDGVSVGIQGLISLEQIRDLGVISSRYGPACAVAVLNVGEMLSAVAGTQVRVEQQDAAEWESFAKAHAIITGYQSFPPGNEGRRRIRDFQRHLVKLARLRYFPQGGSALLQS